MHGTEISPKKRKRTQANTSHSEKQNEKRPQPKSCKILDSTNSRGKNDKNKRTPWTLSKTDPPAKPQMQTLGPYIKTSRERSADKESKRLTKKARITENHLCLPDNQRLTVNTRRYMCPITGCKNFGGRGYPRSTFIDHLNRHRHIFLANESEKPKALQAASIFGDLGCYYVFLGVLGCS